MKFYEMKDPYFALIAAEDEKKCLKLYNDLVCEVEDEKEFFEESEVLTLSVDDFRAKLSRLQEAE